MRAIFRRIVTRSGSITTRMRKTGRVDAANLPRESRAELADLYDVLAETCRTALLFDVWDEFERDLRSGLA